MNLGYFSSFTVFLALNDASFAAKWLPGLLAAAQRPPGAGLISLGGYMRFWGWAYLAITAGVALLTRERRTRVASGSSRPANGAPGRGAQPARAWGACLHACCPECTAQCVLTASVCMVNPCLLGFLQTAPMGCAAAPAWQPQSRRMVMGMAAQLPLVLLMLLMERRMRRPCR
jgi:hypothetical protein